MKPVLTRLAKHRRLLPVAALWLGAVWTAPASGRELVIAGVYEDAGTVITPPPDGPADFVSLHALISLEFFPGLARVLHEKTAAVRLTHEAGELKVEVVDRSDEVSWRATWLRGKDFSEGEDRLTLQFRPGRVGDDGYVLTFSTVTEHRLLQIEVRRQRPTFFGPVFEPMGVFLFHRLE